MGTKQFRITVGLYILMLALLMSNFCGFGLYIDLSENRIQLRLKANPHLYSEYMLNVLLNLIMSPTVGLTYSIIAFIKDKKSRTLIPEWPVAGSFFIFVGACDILWSYGLYSDIMEWINTTGQQIYPNGFAEVVDPISNIISSMRVADFLWILAGILFIILPIFRMRIRKESLEEILWY